MKNTQLVLLLSLAILISACSKVYVCYDGTTRQTANTCPIVPISKVTSNDAGLAMDNFGMAVANAKGDQYSRVNLYNQNGTWFANVLFTNRETQLVKQTLFRIDGDTGDVSCMNGCDYLNAKPK